MAYHHEKIGCSPPPEKILATGLLGAMALDPKILKLEVFLQRIGSLGTGIKETRLVKSQKVILTTVGKLSI